MVITFKTILSLCHVKCNWLVMGGVLCAKINGSVVCVLNRLRLLLRSAANCTALNTHTHILFVFLCRLPVCSGVSRRVQGCGPHRAALATRGSKRATIVFKNSREISDCKFHLCLRAIKTKRYSQRVPIVGTVGDNILRLIETYASNSCPVSKT